MASDDQCVSCAWSASPDLPPRERVHVGPRWRVAHAFGTSLPGWLVVLPRRHVIALDELTAVHFHVVPRSPELDQSLRGPRVFGLLGGDPAGHLPDQVMNQTAATIGQALRLDI